VVLAVIGRNWIDARDAGGARRLDDPHDFVRGRTTCRTRCGRWRGATPCG
jgi:hypothetical protein